MAERARIEIGLCEGAVWRREVECVLDNRGAENEVVVGIQFWCAIDFEVQVNEIRPRLTEVRVSNNTVKWRRTGHFESLN